MKISRSSWHYRFVNQFANRSSLNPIGSVSVGALRYSWAFMTAGLWASIFCCVGVLALFAVVVIPIQSALAAFKIIELSSNLRRAGLEILGIEVFLLSSVGFVELLDRLILIARINCAATVSKCTSITPKD